MRPDSRETQLQRGSSTRVDENRRVQRAEGKKSEPLVCCYRVICSVRSGGRRDAVIRGVSIRAIQVRASYSYLAAGGFVHRDNQTKTACRDGRGTGVKARYEAVLGREMASSAPSSVPFSHHKTPPRDSKPVLPSLPSLPHTEQVRQQSLPFFFKNLQPLC